MERISSNDLSHRMKVTASQIRQDLNNFGGIWTAGITDTMFTVSLRGNRKDNGA